MRLLVALVIWAGAVVGAVAVSNVVAGSIHNTSAGSGSSGDASSITASDPQSLFRTANFQKALATARSQLGADAQLSDFTLYPGYLSVTAVKPGTQTDFYVNAFGSTNTTTASIDTPNSGLFPLSRVTATLPAAFARHIASAAHVPTSQLHYMVAQVDSSSGQFQWLAYTVPGSPVEYLQANGGTGALSEYRTNSSTGLQPVSG